MLGRIKGDERQAETVDRKAVEDKLKKWIQVRHGAHNNFDLTHLVVC